MRSKFFLFAPLAVTLAQVFPASSRAENTAFASSVVKGAASSARLLSAGPPQGGSYRAAVEIALAPETITYWRQPGEAGSAPAFDFSKSVNVAKVEPSFPAPKHIDEAGTIVAGYDARVVLPLKVTPRDPNAPVTLNLVLDYASCGKICLPARADLSLELPRERRFASCGGDRRSRTAGAKANSPRPRPKSALRFRGITRTDRGGCATLDPARPRTSSPKRLSRSSLKARARERASSLSFFPEAKPPRPPTRR